MQGFTRASIYAEETVLIKYTCKYSHPRGKIKIEHDRKDTLRRSDKRKKKKDRKPTYLGIS
jgi:hypothetical protein